MASVTIIRYDSMRAICPGDWLQRRDQPAQRCQPRVHLQPGGDQRDPEAQRGAGENCFDWIVPDMVGEEQPGV